MLKLSQVRKHTFYSRERAARSQLKGLLGTVMRFRSRWDKLGGGIWKPLASASDSWLKRAICLT